MHKGGSQDRLAKVRQRAAVSCGVEGAKTDFGYCFRKILLFAKFHRVILDGGSALKVGDRDHSQGPLIVE